MTISAEELLADAPESLRREAKVKRRGFSGNENLPGCPIYMGWFIRLDGRSLPAEKAWLKAHGFAFSGGEWFRRDEEPTHYAPTTVASEAGRHGYRVESELPATGGPRQARIWRKWAKRCTARIWEYTPAAAHSAAWLAPSPFHWRVERGDAVLGPLVLGEGAADSFEQAATSAQVAFDAGCSRH